MNRMRAGALLTAILALATPASAACKIKDGTLVCDQPPTPTPGGGDLHLGMIDLLKPAASSSKARN